MIPAIIVAGTHSGCGKTTISGALMAALVKRGLTVQPFKVGPDFIDPTHHTAICGRYSRNLDPYMMGKEGLIDTFSRACKGADIAVIEGVMGLYDGLDGGDTGSTAHVSKILGIPVVLIADAKGSSRSINAVVKGFESFDREVNITGVIFNRIGSERHRRMIECSIVKKAYGWIPYEKDKTVESRHLGIQMAYETSTISEFAGVLEDNCNIDAILDDAGSSINNKDSVLIEKVKEKKIKIGIAHDMAFNFYYSDNLDILRRYGAELVFFSPIADRMPKVDALYLGGGYPELFGEQLERSKCRDDIKRAADSGLPVYAECGGLTYLTERIEIDNIKSEMCGLIPAETIKMDRFQALGYIDAECTAGGCIIPRNTCFRGHEFHYTKLTGLGDVKFALKLRRGNGIENGKDGIYVKNILAGYTHAYFTENFAKGFIDNVLLKKRASTI
ncbi:MAG: hydrogenobyrinic acid a,c-diamide synthase (glutamine-hydrolyzing) [Methanomicrobiaceae archaeon]|nr:hydrogenobyrinic acid a,c-diamide synthase (glutamine-hydrolyzing) [Methanomicrobiaceae archaeon]